MDLPESFTDDWMFDTYQRSQKNDVSKEPSGLIDLGMHSQIQTPKSHSGTASYVSRPDLTFFCPKQPNTSNIQFVRLLRDASHQSTYSPTVDTGHQTFVRTSIPGHPRLVPNPKDVQCAVSSSSYNEQIAERKVMSQMINSTQSKTSYFTSWTKREPVKVCLATNEWNGFSYQAPFRDAQNKGLTWINNCKSSPGPNQAVTPKTSFTESSQSRSLQLSMVSNGQNYSTQTNSMSSLAPSQTKYHVQLDSRTPIASGLPVFKPITNNFAVETNKQPAIHAQLRQYWQDSNTWLQSSSFDIIDDQSSTVTSNDWLNKNINHQKNINAQSYHLKSNSETKEQYELAFNQRNWNHDSTKDVFNLEDFLNDHDESDDKDINNDNLVLGDGLVMPEEICPQISLNSSSDSLTCAKEICEPPNKDAVCTTVTSVEKTPTGQYWLKTCQQMLEDIDRNVVSLSTGDRQEDNEVINRSFEIMEDDAHSRPDNESLCDFYEAPLIENAAEKRRIHFSCDTSQTPSRFNGKRKPLTPIKSPRARDPTFRGVVVKMKTKLQDDRAHLDIRAYFSCKKNCRRHQHLKKRYLDSSLDKPSEEPEIPLQPSTVLEKEFLLPRESKRRCPLLGKQCASCGTKKTPLWRDAEDGTSLCNACGIRFKKYRVRCTTCWHIPRKDTKTDPTCHRCGEILKVPPMSTKVCL